MARHTERLEGPTNYPGYTVIEAHRKSTMGIMAGVREDLIAQGLTTKMIFLHKGWDIHCFFPRPEDPSKLIHLQLYMQAQRSSTVDVQIREIDKVKLSEARKLVSIGSEEFARIKTLQKRAPVLWSHDMIFELLKQVLKEQELPDNIAAEKQAALAEFNGLLARVIEQKHQQNLAKRGYYLDFLTRRRDVTEPQEQY
jgi:hypothetical protein